MRNSIKTLVEKWRSGSRAQVIGTLGSNGILGVFGMAAGVFGARLFGPAGKGELAVILAAGSLIAVCTTLGLDDAVVFFTSKDPGKGAVFSVAASSFLLFVGVIVLAGSGLLMPLLLVGQRPGVVLGGQLFLSVLFAYALLVGLQGFLRGRRRIGRWNALRVIISGFWLVILAIAWLLGDHKPEHAAGAYAVGLSLVAVAGWWLHRNDLKTGWPPVWQELRAMLRYGVPIAARSGPRALNLRLDVVLMAAVLPASDIGIYSVAVTWSMILAPVPESLSAVAFPRLSAETDTVNRLALERRMVVATLIVVCVGYLSLAAVTPTGIALLFGSEFIEAIPYAFALFVSGAGFACAQLLEALLKSRGRTGGILFAELAGLAVTLVGLWILLPRLQIWGAVLVTCAAYLTVVAVLVIQLWEDRRKDRCILDMKN